MRNSELNRIGVYIEEITDPDTFGKSIRRTVHMRDYYVVTMFEWIKDPETGIRCMVDVSEERHERKT